MTSRLGAWVSRLLVRLRIAPEGIPQWAYRDIVAGAVFFWAMVLAAALAFSHSFDTVFFVCAVASVAAFFSARSKRILLSTKTPVRLTVPLGMAAIRPPERISGSMREPTCTGGLSDSGVDVSPQPPSSGGQSFRRGSTPKCVNRSSTGAGSNCVPAHASIS
jgi:hypothetical protein